MRLKRRVHPKIARAKLRAGRRDREQEVVELNSKVPVQNDETKKTETLEINLTRSLHHSSSPGI